MIAATTKPLRETPAMTMIYDPAHPIVRADPYPAYARLRTEDPVHWHTGLKCWILTRYDDVAAALSGPSMSPDRLTPFYAALPEATQNLLAEMMRYLNLWIVFRDPPAHTRVRGLVNKAFLPGTILGFKPRIEQIVARLLDDLAKKDEADLVADFTMPLPALVIMAMMGVPEDRLYDVKGWSDDIMLFIGTARATPDKYERARRGAVEMAGLFRGEIEKRRADPGTDLLEPADRGARRAGPPERGRTRRDGDAAAVRRPRDDDQSAQHRDADDDAPSRSSAHGSRPIRKWRRPRSRSSCARRRRPMPWGASCARRTRCAA